MERMWPKENILPLFQFYMAKNIEDMLSSRESVVVYSLESFLEEHKAAKELKFMVHSDNLLNRVMFILGSVETPYIPDILVGKNQNPTLYRLTETYIFLPRVQHVRERDGKVRGGVVLFDHSGEVEASFPTGLELASVERHCWLNVNSLKENDWQSAVVVRCDYSSRKDKYTLIHVFNRWAMENQEKVIQDFIAKLAPKFAR